MQGLAWGTELPVVPVSSLAAVAQLSAETAGATHHDVVVAMDARMQEVFHCVFRASERGIVEPLTDERVSVPARLEPGKDRPFIAAGNGFERYGELAALGQAAEICLPDLWPRASMVLKLAGNWLLDNEPLIHPR